MVDYLESLERLAMPDELHIKECEKLGISLTEDFDIVEQALLELKSIKEANTSEVLEDLQVIENNIIYLLSDCDTNDEVEQCLKDTKAKISTIKQALIKEQEPKQYLKWEDLEFKKKQQVMDVLLNGKPYILYFCKLSTQNEVTIFSIDMHIVTLSSNYPEDVQFFNDLHLERVEE